MNILWVNVCYGDHNPSGQWKLQICIWGLPVLIHIINKAYSKWQSHIVIFTYSISILTNRFICCSSFQAVAFCSLEVFSLNQFQFMVTMPLYSIAIMCPVTILLWSTEGIQPENIYFQSSFTCPWTPAKSDHLLYNVEISSVFCSYKIGNVKRGVYSGVGITLKWTI